MASTSLEERLTELEVRFAFLEDTVSVLNSTITSHDRLLLEIRDEFRRLRAELGAVRGALTHDPASEPPPPHY
ncbi:SlyX family protein [Tahibacter amnicola]|uniref:Protein SlyX homolog n=1 Tax=Tahibacter amnicola TaxID=2976241 RepID=A0ABY6BMY5_9GAMM|nr:SlyX family protein [Tahibacter amnicola]UXI70415.1 SlyX family protein [Tahibacter amnicola]